MQQINLFELGARRQGKVRDIYEKKEHLILIATDRLSIFDRILQEPIQDKGRILTGIARFWFEETKDILANHIVSYPDPNVMVVKKCTPLPVEVIVRGYLAGSIWRDYAAGKRTKCGIALPEGLQQNDPLPFPIVTPTTKSQEGHDEDISKEEIISQKIMTAELWNEIEKKAIALYNRGSGVLKKRGLILIDTKYEFGLDVSGKLTLIDEIHTPDSSRFWFEKDRKRKEIRFPDKEFVRQWARASGFIGEGPLIAVPEEIQNKVREGYREIYEAITGVKLEEEILKFPQRMLENLKKEGIVKGACALVVLESEKDKSRSDKMAAVFEENGVACRIEVPSNQKDSLALVDAANQSLEPLVCISIETKSNALSSLFAANLKWPVIGCPFFQDESDATLQLPREVPVLTIIDPESAALAAVKILKAAEGAL